MRYVRYSVGVVAAFLTFAAPAARGALNVSITNYQAVSDRRATLTEWYVTFKADLVNAGPALPGITATVSCRSTGVQVVAGQGTLHFPPVPANGRVTSTDTFTLLVNRSVPFDWNQVEWFFNNPVANAGANQTAPLTGAVTLDGSASTNPSGSGTLAYRWTFQSIPAGSRAVLSRADTASPSFVVDAPGTYRCQLTVTNGSGADTALVTVSTVNSPPVASAGSNRTVAVGESVTLNGSRSSDVDGDTLAYSWSFVSVPAKSNSLLLGSRTVLPTFVADVAGTYIVQLIVNDGKADSQPSTVTISTANTVPVANAGVAQTVTAGMFVQLSGAGSTDIDGDSLTYRWSFNLLPQGSAAVLSSLSAVNPTFTADKAGTYIVQLIVNDGKTDSVPATVTITTNAVQPPTARAGSDVTVHAGTTVQLGGSGTDPQSFPLTYTWSLPTRPPDSTATLSATNIPNPTFLADVPGVYGAQLVVNNGVLSSSPSTVTITTTNTAPVADPGPPQSAYTGDTVYLDGSKSSDADNDAIVAYSWSFTSKPESSLASLSGANTKLPSFVADVAGPYVVQLIVSDKYSSSQAKTVMISVGARTIRLGPDPLKLYNSPGTLNITLSPTPTTPVSIQLSAVPAGVVSFSPNPATVPANSSGVNVTATPISPGTTTVTASATGYYSSTGTVTVTKPTISIALNGGAGAVALTHKLGGTITIDAPAPPGGVSIALTAAPAPDGEITFESNPIRIAEGGTTAAFAIIGNQVGAVTINATSPGYNPGLQAVQVVMLGSVSLPASITVGTGKSTALRVQLSAPAPADGVTVLLNSSDTTKVTVSPPAVSIKAGATTAEPPPQVSGAAQATGEAIVTATAGGFYSDQQTVKVVAAITFKEQAVSVGPGGVKSFTILLSAPAPAGGLLVYLTSSNESVVTVPVSGALIPAGQLTVDSQVTGVSAGTADITLGTNPSIPGNQYFSGAGAVLNVTVARPALRITTDSLPVGIAGASYTSTTLTATGGTGLGYFWTLPVGPLPLGLNLNTSGVLSGTLSGNATTSTFTVQVQDGAGNRDTKTFTITVTSPITITTDSLPAGVAGSSYPSTNLAATGGSGTGYRWSVASGSLPAGLTLSTAGVISGDLPSSAVTSSFTVQVQDSAGNTTSRQLSITVGAKLAITTSSVPTGTAGASYPLTTLAASGGTGSGYSWSVQNGSLPLGLILSTAGVISGKLDKSATTASFTVQVKDGGNNTATRQFTLTVNAALGITTEAVPSGMRGAAYATTILTATGGSGSGYTWSVSFGSLPDGLTLSSSGALSGTFSASATTSTFTIQVLDGAGAAASAEFTITVYPALSITTPSVPAGTAGSDYPSRLLAAAGGSGIGYTWSVSSGALPKDLALSTNGVLSGSLSGSATTSTFTIQVKDSANNTATKEFTLTVNAAIQITTSSLPNGSGGVAYPSTTLAATGGSGVGYNWSISAGSLPAGLNLSATGVLSGTLATNATSSTFTVQVKDDALNTATRQLSISVTLAITTSSLPAGDAGKSYSTLLSAAGGTGTGYAWSVQTGVLPSGLTLTVEGVLSGTLDSGATTSTFTIQVRDNANNTGSRQFTLTVNPALTITTASLPAGTTGAPYPSTTLAASGGSNAGYIWSVTVGSLPAGLTLSPGGLLSGTLATSASSATFTVQVQDSGGNSATRQLTISVETALAIVTTSLPDAVAGATYPSTTLSAGGGTGAGYAWSITTGSLPSGLSLSAAGVVSGPVSDSAVTSTFMVQVKDSLDHTATKQFTITVKPAVTITTSSLPAGTVGNAYAQTTLAAAGGSGTGYVWSVCGGSLPSGMTLSSNGVLAGTPSTAVASGTFTLCVQDSSGATASKQFTITINAALTITTASLPAGMAGASYPSTTLTATGGAGSGYSWSVSTGSLPSGMTLSAGGELSGTPIAATTSIFTVQVQDSAGSTGTKQYTLTVHPALTITTSALAAGIAGNAYPSTTLGATGGTGSGYVWSVASGSLPEGLTLSAGGLLSGTLSASATSANVTVRVQDSGGNAATQLFSIAVNPALSITTTSLPDGIAGTAYTPTTLTAGGGSGSNYTWSVSAGSLPQGLSLTPGGSLSGNLSPSAVTSTFTIQVKDGGNNTATKQFTITITAGLGVFTAVLPAGFAGAAYGPVTLTATGGTGTGYSWSVSAGSLPSNLTLNSGGVLSGTLAANAVTATFSVQVKDSANNTATREFTLTVNPALSITTSSLPTGTADSAYPSTTLAATGGTGNGYVWSVSAGSLPLGLALSAGGVLSGTLASSAATATFTVQVKDDGNHTATKQFTINVNPALQVTTTALPAGAAGGAYTSTTLTATGGTGTGYTWTVSIGSLPGGLALSSGGVLSGTLLPAATTSTFTIQVQDSAGNTGRRQFTLTVTLQVTTSVLPGATAGTAYVGATLAASGGTGAGYTWSLAGGSLPAGMTLSSGGLLAGNLLTTAATSTFTVQVQDSGGATATKQLTIAVGPVLSIDTTSLPAGVAGTAYPSTTLSASGGAGSGYTWSITLGALPTGLSLNGASGVISGTLGGSAITATFTVQVKDSANATAAKQFTITVTPALAITTGSLPASMAGNVYPSTNLTASGGTGTGYTWSVTVGSLPNGLMLSSAGALSGTLGASAATATFTVQVQDSGSNTTTKQFTITVYPALAITTGSLPAGMTGSVYPSTDLAATGGTGTGYTWSVSVGVLPNGLLLSSGGAISGTLGGSAATATFTLKVQDSVGNAATKQFTITVYPILVITTTSLPVRTAGSAYPSTTLAASGGTATGFTWSVSVGSLPNGLALSSAGVLSGTLDSSATTSTFTVQVQDSAGNKATRQFTLTVNPALTITTGTLPAAMAGTAYPTTSLAATGGTGTGRAWSVSVGSLPNGLSLSGAGDVSGTLGAAATTATFTVQVQDSGGNTATKQFTITVYPVLAITGSALPAGMAGSVYPSTNLAATGGTGAGYAWSLSAGSLPNGLTLSNSGGLSGTLGALAQTSTFTVQVQDGAGNTATRQFTITVYPALSITTASLPGGVTGSAYTSTTLAATGGSGAGYTWSVSVGLLPLNLTLTSAGVLSGTLSSSAVTSTFTIQVQDGAGNIATKTFTVTVTPLLSITTASLAHGIAGGAYPSTTLTASGGSGGGYTWSLSAGSLPLGLILSNGGVISGAVNASAVTTTFTIQVKDSSNNTATREFTLTIDPALAVNPASLPVGVAGAAYPNTTLTAAGGTGTGYTWSVSVGSLPTGLTLSNGGVISGTLGASAVSKTFTVQVQDSGSNTAIRQFTLTVNPTVSITTGSLPSGMAGATYPSTTIEATGGTGSGYSWSVSDGSLPSNLTLSAGGVISGAVAPSATSSTFTVQVQDSGGNTATKQYTLSVLPALTITTGSSLAGGVAGSPYPTVTLAASGGTNAGYTWSLTAGSLPTGLTLSSTGGSISGTLAYIAVTSTFTVQVKDNGNHTATKQFTIAVTPATLTFTTGSTLPNATRNSAYSAAINALGGTLPYTWSGSGLPAWLTLDTAGNVCGGAGIVCGTPTAYGVFTFNVTVTDNGSPTRQSVTQPFTVTVTGAGGLGVIVVPDVSVGVNLQAPLVITLSPPTSATTIMTLSTSNASALRLGNSSEAGSSPLSVSLPAGTSSMQVYVKALTLASPVTITVAADVGYTSGSGLATIANSGFVLTGPNGTGNSFTTFQGVTTGLTAAPYRLGANNIPVENQQIRGGLNVNAPIAVLPGSMGTMGSPAMAFSGGDLISSGLFTASYTASGEASITISPPLGSSFISPATGATINVSIQSSGFVVPSGITVGRNLQVPLTIGVTGPAAHDTIVTIASSDANSLKFSTTQTGVGLGTIQVVIRTGYSATPTIYARSYGSSGSVPYTVTAADTYGSVTTSMPLGPSGFVIGTPSGPGADFSVTLGSPDPTLELQTALFTPSGSMVEYQTVAPDANVTAALTSFTPSVGVVSSTSLQVLGGTYSRSFTFHAASVGFTNITATATGYTGASVKATVTNVSVFLNPVGSVGRFLAAQGQVNLSSPATANVPVTLSVSSGPIKLAVNKTDAGGNTITVNVLPGSTNATFWVFGTASSGTGIYTASAMGQSSLPDNVALTPSGVALYMGSPGNPSCFGTGYFGCTMTLAGGARTVYAVTYQLLPDGSNTINGSQPLAGGVALSVPLNNGSPGTGSAPAAVSIPGGSIYGSFTFTPSAPGSTILTLGTLSGWSPPIAFGFDLSQLGITVN